jgi:hypothetical protein
MQASSAEGPGSSRYAVKRAWGRNPKCHGCYRWCYARHRGLPDESFSSSSPRERAQGTFGRKRHWIPASAGMTSLGYAALASSNLVAILAIECRPHASTRNSPSIPALRAGPLAGWLAPLSVPRVERVAQAVADEIERQHQQKNGQTGPYRHPRCIVDVILGGIEHASPGRRRRLLAKAQK